METTSQNNNPSAICNERLISASPREIFDAFERPDRLAQWWGPDGFTNTFEKFEFNLGGKWVFVMHGPDGANYANESVFQEIQPDTKIVIEHVVQPWFTLTITLTPRDNKTHLTWVQEFKSPEIAEKLRAIVPTANEQNLNRLEALLAGNNS